MRLLALEVNLCHFILVLLLQIHLLGLQRQDFSTSILFLCPWSFDLSVEFIPFVIFQVYVHNMVTEDGLVSRSSEFEAAIQNGERTLLRVLCDKKSQESV